MIYADSSVWVALLTPEAGTARVEQWFEDLSETPVSVDWTLTEFHSAIALKTRIGQLLSRQAKDVLVLCEQLIAGGLTLTPVSRIAYRAAAALADDLEQGLRGADAWHIAAAQELGVERFATLDRRQGVNAQRLGLTLEPGMTSTVAGQPPPALLPIISPMRIGRSGAQAGLKRRVSWGKSMTTVDPS